MPIDYNCRLLFFIQMFRHEGNKFFHLSFQFLDLICPFFSFILETFEILSHNMTGDGDGDSDGDNDQEMGIAVSWRCG